jgi:hypothetical protein
LLRNEHTLGGTIRRPSLLTVPNSPSPQPIFDHIYAGLAWSATVSSQPAADIWLDEIIVDKNATICGE